MNKEEKAVKVMQQFEAQYPWVKADLRERGLGYVLTLDYSFTNLDAEQQAKGREGINTVLTALKGIGIPVHLELGYV
jgi:hypothetical protein